MHGCTGQGMVLGFACAFPFRDCARCAAHSLSGIVLAALRIPISLAARALAKIGRCKPQACLWQIFLCEPATRKTSFPDGGYTQKKPAVAGLHLLYFCGEIGIRTLVTVTRQPALQTGALDHSAISPGGSFGSANIAYFLLSCYIAEEKSYSQHKMLSI